MLLMDVNHDECFYSTVCVYQSIENNQTTAIHVQDPSVLPELCEIHRHQMPQMLRSRGKVQDIMA